MTNADAIALWLVEKKITHCFGIIGAGNIAIFDAIARLGKTTPIFCHHEQACAQAATYYYRVSQKIAPVLCTTGAGSSNTLTGVLAAFMDSQPLIVISGNEPSNFFNVSHPRVIGVQGYDSVEVARPITKWVVRLEGIDDLETAYKIALTPRYGPVWCDVCRDVQQRRV